MTLSEQILHVQRRDKRPVRPKGKDLLRAALPGWEEQVSDTQPSEQPLSPTHFSSVLFMKDKRTVKEQTKRKIFPARTDLTLQDVHNKCLRAVGPKLASQPIYCSQSQLKLWLWSIVPFKLMCCCLWDHNMCTPHHTGLPLISGCLFFAGPCKKTQSTLTVSAGQDYRIKTWGSPVTWAEFPTFPVSHTVQRLMLHLAIHHL